MFVYCVVGGCNNVIVICFKNINICIVYVKNMGVVFFNNDYGKGIYIFFIWWVVIRVILSMLIKGGVDIVNYCGCVLNDCLGIWCEIVIF